jgi:hypothetical protein
MQRINGHRKPLTRCRRSRRRIFRMALTGRLPPPATIHTTPRRRLHLGLSYCAPFQRITFVLRYMKCAREVCAAGPWKEWQEPDGSCPLSMSMLIVNADRPSADEAVPQAERPSLFDGAVSVLRRAVVISTDEARSCRQFYPAETMHAEAYPLPPQND